MEWLKTFYEVTKLVHSLRFWKVPPKKVIAL